MSNTTFFCPSSPQFLPLTSGFLLGWFESYDPGHGCDELMAQCSKMTFLFTKKKKMAFLILDQIQRLKSQHDKSYQKSITGKERDNRVSGTTRERLVGSRWPSRRCRHGPAPTINKQEWMNNAAFFWEKKKGHVQLAGNAIFE